MYIAYQINQQKLQKMVHKSFTLNCKLSFFLFECSIYCVCFIGYRCSRRCGGRSMSLHLEVASWISLKILSRWVRQGLCRSSTAQNFIKADILSNVHINIYDLGCRGFFLVKVFPYIIRCTVYMYYNYKGLLYL